MCSDDEGGVTASLVAGCSLDELDFRGRTPCMFAVEMNLMGFMNALDVAVCVGNCNAVKICLNTHHSFTPSSCQDETAWDPLHLAVESNNPGMVERLDPVRCDHHFTPTAIDYAVTQGSSFILGMLIDFTDGRKGGTSRATLTTSLMSCLAMEHFTAGHRRCFELLFLLCLPFWQTVEDSNGESVLSSIARWNRVDCFKVLTNNYYVLENLRYAVVEMFAHDVPSKVSVSTLRDGEVAHSAARWKAFFYSLRRKKTMELIELCCSILEKTCVTKEDLSRFKLWAAGPPAPFPVFGSVVSFTPPLSSERCKGSHAVGLEYDLVGNQELGISEDRRTGKDVDKEEEEKEEEKAGEEREEEQEESDYLTTSSCSGEEGLDKGGDEEGEEEGEEEEEEEKNNFGMKDKNEEMRVGSRRKIRHSPSFEHTTCNLVKRGLNLFTFGTH